MLAPHSDRHICRNMAIQDLRVLFVSHLQLGQAATTRLGEPLASPGGDYEGLFKQYKRLFNSKPGKFYGRFSEDTGTSPFSAWLRDHLDGRQSFASFSERLLGQWEELVTQRDLEFAGPIMLVHETLADSEVVYLFLLETDSAMLLDNQLGLDATEVLSTSRLDLAARIELDDWRSEAAATNYLTLVRARGTGDLGLAFSDLVGFQSSVDVEQETRTFLDAVEAFARQSEPEDAQKVRTRAYDFCKQQHDLGEPVPIDALSGFLDEQEPTRFKSFVNEAQVMPEDAVLHPDHRKVKKLVRISGAGNGISLSFSSDLVNQAVYYDREKDAITITKLPKALKLQLQQYLERGKEES